MGLMTIKRLPPVVAAVAALAGAMPAAAEMAMGGAMPMMQGEGMHKMLTDAEGMTLYTFDKDAQGMSACYDDCAMNWPPALAAEGAMAEGDLALTERRDGAKQWTFRGMPLYTWAKDKMAGDMSGDGMNGVWHVAKP
ncbi:COG4315 family predicted lipoprotein [Frigidibacter sp. MR17.24]|uniref:COG4315 family predicted lipoprotein n=1 Tax=Frigidibacter sp. MR17.24 TaxID=3127345 RepID=UPI003012D557